jgi:hypothetical protein
MGKKSREKKARREGTTTSLVTTTGEQGLYAQLEDAGSGDLRLVGQHVEKFLEGVREAEEALLLLGRDASALVIAEAAKRDDPRLVELGRKLAAMPPRVSTNLHELRKASVAELAEAGLKRAPALSRSPKVEVHGPAAVLFDPLRIADALARSGRVRNDTERVTRGDIAWFGLGAASSYTLTLTSAAPTDAPILRAPLEVGSGVLFVGPPEAADGPRLGTVRLDPHKTALDDHAVRGGFVAVPPGRYAVALTRGAKGLVVHLTPAAPEETFEVDFGLLGQTHGDV